MPETTRAFIAKMNKLLGAEVLIPAEDLVIPRRYLTGCLSLDVATGGGLPGNQWCEIIGMESSGKTFTLLKMIAVNQKADPEFATLWVAAEHFDSEQAQALGVDLSRIDIARTQAMETALQIMIEGAASRDYDAVILDSYPALVPGEEAEKAMDEHTTATGARLLNQFIRKVGPAGLRRHDGTDRPFTGIIVNQWRDQIGGFQRFGTPRTTPGGKGKNYFFYARIEVTREEWKTEKRPGIEDPVKVGQRIRYKTVKNKSAAPQQSAHVDAYFRDAPSLGFRRGDYDTVKDCTDTAIDAGVVDRAGSWYRFAGQQYQGREAFADALRAEPALRDRLYRNVLELTPGPRALTKEEQ